jgi:hypothetical protein
MLTNLGHEESYKDVPRLTTVQAQLLIMKAKESQPQRRGYFYRSWMSLVNIVAMSKDLGLHEHLEDHEDGGSCGFSTPECICRTRIWQTLCILEAMIGGPQGKAQIAFNHESLLTFPQLVTISLSIQRLWNSTNPAPNY